MQTPEPDPMFCIISTAPQSFDKQLSMLPIMIYVFAACQTVCLPMTGLWLQRQDLVARTGDQSQCISNRAERE